MWGVVITFLYPNSENRRNIINESSSVLDPSSMPGIKWLCKSVPIMEKSNGGSFVFFAKRFEKIFILIEV
jgi:hypothetical protein